MKTLHVSLVEMFVHDGMSRTGAEALVKSTIVPNQAVLTGSMF